ncbi:MAG: 4-hydroxyphenylacetate 3-hydroxylase [Actinomycetota bacterium]|nr:4-hydroxyphenylacetate 3-hydroxylase [Actinomycetota bacterium]
MPARTGAQFLDGLRARRREVWLGDERVDDVTTHPQLRGAAHALAGVFDRQHAFADDCLMPDPETGEDIGVSHMIPRSVDDLKRRHRGLRRIAEYSVGIMGRTPDYMNVTFAGFAGERGAWLGPDAENVEGHDNLRAYQRTIAREDLSLTHAIVHPTIDRVKDASFADNPVPLHKVGDTATGIVVRGARILATLAPFADEMTVYPGFPLPTDATDAYALSFAVPMDTPGLIFLCRDSASTVGSNRFDHPLSSRFDEQDAFVIFHDVEVPRERVFIDGDIEVYNSVMGPTAWWPNIMQQTTIRAMTKLEFAYGLACRMAEAVNDTSAPTMEMLGELSTYVEVTRNAVLLSEEHAFDRGDGVVFPDGRPMHPMRSILAAWYPRVREILMLIGSHNLLAVPSQGMLGDDRLRPMIEEFLHGADDMDAERRAAIYRLAWDFIGSGLGSRNELYERNYLASARTNRTLHHLQYSDRSAPYELVEAMLG